MGERIAICRFCGAEGVENDSGDPAPGVCPECLDAKLMAIMEKLEPPVMGKRDALMADLTGIGMTAEAARAYISDLAMIDEARP